MRDQKTRPFWSWLAPVILTGLAMTLSVWVGIQLAPAYGLGLFVLLPIGSGFLATALCRLFGSSRRTDALATATLAQLVAALGLILWGIEGIVCLVMAAPLAIPLAILGAWVAHLLLGGERASVALAIIPLGLAGPLLDIAIRSWTADRSASVTTTVEIAAPPETVWRHVIEFPELSEPKEWYFRAGVAYPIRARIEGRGPGAVRRCEFSTGAFVEPIREWKEPALLSFAVTSNPEPLRELSPYDIHPPHLHGWFQSTRGQFRLERLPGNRTRLIGTTWYTQRLQPAIFWRIWTDAIVHRIHGRVLNHIRTLSETTASAR